MIQHPWVTKSIEKAQKRLEENNFGIRKRLLEYDDVMNIQREAIYNKRTNALYGQRLAVDIHNSSHLASAAQHAAVLQWFERRQIQIRANHEITTQLMDLEAAKSAGAKSVAAKPVAKKAPAKKPAAKKKA